MIAQAECAAELMSDLDSKIDALERGLHEYEVGLAAWTDGVLRKVDHQADDVEQRLQARARELDERTTALECAIAGWDHRQTEMVERQSGIEVRERELKELAELLAQAERDANAREQSVKNRLQQGEAGLREREQTLAEELAQVEECKASIARQSSDLEHGREELDAAIKRSEDECAARRAELDTARTDAEQLLARLEEQTRQLESRESELAVRERDLIERDRNLSKTQEACRTREGEIDDRLTILQRERDALQRQRTEIDAVVQTIASREEELEQTARKLTERVSDLARREDSFKETRRNAETLVADYRQRELALTAGINNIEERAAELDRKQDKLNAAEAALRTERVELDAAGESFEAETAAKRMEQGRTEEELSERRAELDRDRAAHESAVVNLSRRNEELDRRTKALSDREADLATQQSRLEVALDNIKNDRLAVQKARAVADDVAQSRSEELTRVRAEGDALRGEIASLRENTERLERELREAQDAAERETNTARKAQCELKTFSAQSESAKTAAIESLEAERQRELSEARSALQELRFEVDRQQQEKQRLENDLLNALESREKTVHSLQEVQVESQRLAEALAEERAQALVRLADIEKREQEALALIEKAERKCASAVAAPDTSINESDHIIQSGNASHAGVALFWTAFATTGSCAEGIGHEALAEIEASAPLNEIYKESSSPKSKSASAGQDPPANESEASRPDDMAAAMKAALAAAQAEVSETEREEAPATQPSKSRARAAAKRGKATQPSSKLSQDVARLPQRRPVIEKQKAETPPAHSPLTELDQDTRSKMKMLKRLNPMKSEQELLAMIAADATRPDQGNAKAKRGWFSRR